MRIIIESWTVHEKVDAEPLNKNNARAFSYYNYAKGSRFIHAAINLINPSIYTTRIGE